MYLLFIRTLLPEKYYILYNLCLLHCLYTCTINTVTREKTDSNHICVSTYLSMLANSWRECKTGVNCLHWHS